MRCACWAWLRLDPGLATANRHGLAVANDGRTLLTGTTIGGLWASADGGGHWATVSMLPPPIYVVRFG